MLDTFALMASAVTFFLLKLENFRSSWRLRERIVYSRSVFVNDQNETWETQRISDDVSSFL